MRLLLLVIFLFVVNCNFNKIVDSHGSHYLEKKHKKLLDCSKFYFDKPYHTTNTGYDTPNLQIDKISNNDDHPGPKSKELVSELLYDKIKHNFLK